MILHAPAKPFLHKLSLMNFDIVILEYGQDVSFYMVVYEMKYTLHLLWLEELLPNI